MGNGNERNQVTDFMYYMYNRWSLDESKMLFGDNLGQHIYDKWLHHKQGSGGDLYWYSELDRDCRNKLVARAVEVYSSK